VRPGEVDELEDALADAVGPGEAVPVEVAPALDALDPGAVDDEDLAGLDVADVGGADEVEGARLTRHAVGRGAALARDAAEGEGAEPVGVAHGDERVVGQDDEGEGALAAVEGVDDPGRRPLLLALRDE